MNISGEIAFTKDFWNITNIKHEIMDWKFNNNNNNKLQFNIGHPINSHKGPSIGDMIAYSTLPRHIKQIYGNNVRVNVPPHFKSLFQYNPYIDTYNDDYDRWGSLGTFGNTIQRTCNVWGIQTWDTNPELYYTNEKKDKTALLFCINSKTGGTIKNISKIYSIIEELKTKYYCVQLLMKNEIPIKNANELVFNISKDNIIPFVSNFNYYIGAQNSIYHISKGLGLNVITLLPENIDPYFVVLPLLTQINRLEIEMLPTIEISRCQLWCHKIHKLGKNPNDSHHIGWLYPDIPHLTMRDFSDNPRCPSATPNIVLDSINNKIFPYNNPMFWRIDKYLYLWDNVKGE